MDKKKVSAIEKEEKQEEMKERKRKTQISRYRKEGMEERKN